MEMFKLIIEIACSISSIVCIVIGYSSWKKKDYHDMIFAMWMALLLSN